MILDRPELAVACSSLRASGQRIVFTNGCYDLLHVGHVRLLQAARDLGDVLVVGINSDRSVRGLKGEGRPLVSEQERAELVDALRCVDMVSVFDEDTPVEIIRSVRPHVHVKGGDYDANSLPETPAVREGGGRIHIFPLVHGHSTTDLVTRARQL